jgi:cytochrome c peroxidase
MRRTIAPLVLAALAVSLTVACKKEPAAPPPPPPPSVDEATLAPFEPLPDAATGPGVAPAADLVDLGRMLYYEPRLSKSQTISCNSCHDLSNYGVDGQPTSDGHKGQRGDRNSPTVFNAAAHFVQFWDGRAPDVEEQAKGPILNPVEMAMPSEARVVATLTSMPEYVEAFKKAFPGDPKPLTYSNMAKAIGAFERGLMTPSRWDALLKGDKNALTPTEAVGLKTFVDAGCQTCHHGALLGGTSYQRIGLVKDFPRMADPGRMKITKDAGDRSVFKVPSLRNVEKTGPYYHDGATASLEQAVRDMATYQLGKTLTDQDTARIVEFLKVLTGRIDPEYIKPPVLPKSTPATPKPVVD